MRAWIIGLLAGLLLLTVALPVGLLWSVLYTESGVNLLARHLPQHLGNVAVQVRGVHGSVAHGLHIDQLLIFQRRTHLSFRDIDLNLDLAPALLQTLHARTLSIGELRIEVIRRTRPYVPTPLHFLPSWLNVQIDALHILHGTLVLPSGRQLSASDLRTHGTVRARSAHYFDASMRSADVAFASHAGVLRGTLTLAIAADLALDYHLPGIAPWQVQLRGDGDLNDLPFNGKVTQPFQARFTGRGLDLTARWHVDGNTDVTHIALDTWGASHKVGNASGRLVVQLNEQGFIAAGTVVPEALGAGIFDARMRGHYAHRTLQVEEFSATHRASGTHLSAQGSAALEHGGPRLDLHGTWSHLSWPLVHTPGVRSETGLFSIAGTWPYDLRAHGDLSISHLPPVDFAFSSALYQDRLQINSATLDGRRPAAGRVTFSGLAQWLPQHAWSVTGTASEVNPAAFADIAAGDLSFGFVAHGGGFHPTDAFSVEVQDLTGRMHNLSARGAGRLARDGAVWRFEAIRAQLAGTSVALDGSLSDRVAMKFDIRSPDLSLLLPQLHGHVGASGEIHGDWRNPAVQASISGAGLKYDRIALGELSARVDVDPARSAASHVDVHARALTLGTRTIDDLRLKLDGEERGHDLELKFTARDFIVAAHGSGSFNDGQWRGRLNQMSIIGSDALNLALEAPASISVAALKLQVEPLCLKGSPAHLCIGGEWTPARWSLQASATELPMQTLTAGQSSGLDYRGAIGMALKLQGSGTAQAVGTLSAHLADAQLRHRLASGKIEITTLGSGDVLVTATPASIGAQLGLDAGAQGSIKGLFSAVRTGGPWRGLPLSGALALRTAQLDFIPLYVPQVDRAAGRLEANLDIAGTLGAPLLRGSLSLDQGELDLYQINLAMRAATLKATLQDNRLDFDGAAQFGAGHAAVRGGLEWRGGAPHGQFTLNGTALRVADVPEAQIDASPDLKFQIDAERINVTGIVRIPRARIAPADLTHAVLASSDEVIVTSAHPEPANHYQVTSDVTMALGEDVTVEGLGLKARLSGSITEHVASDEQVTHASGELNVAQGDYTAYGRKLQIERGRLIFTGGPIADPGVDVRAVKHFDDPTAGATLAGINVRGTLRSPLLSFFSEPPLPQQQIVSLLLAGGGLVGGQTPGIAGTNAARGASNNELLGQGAAILGQQLGSHIGITDVGVESNIYNETSLVLGRYLSPRLYVSYGLGLTQTLNTVKLRYTLGDHWIIRTEAGQVGGADLVYTLDK